LSPVFGSIRYPLLAERGAVADCETLFAPKQPVTKEKKPCQMLNIPKLSN
jgi:hypothetical protein